MERLIINNREYFLKIAFFSKKNSSACVKGNIIHLRISNKLNREVQMRHIISLKKSMIKRLNSRVEPPELGDEINVLGKLYKVSAVESNTKRSYGRLIENNIILKLTDPSHRDYLIQRLIAKDQLPFVKGLVNDFNREHFNSEVNEVRIRTQTSRWGSCSSKNNINISSKALFLPRRLLDYILVHELAHTKQRNHSKNFWELVEKVIPDYRERRALLRRHS